MADKARVRPAGTVGTEFYRRRIGDWFRRYVIELVMLAVIIVFAVVTAVVTTTARRVFREAKDVRLALRAVGTEYYGNLSCIYDPDAYNGLAEGAAERIEKISTHDGEVYLYSWNSEDNTPLRFEYRQGLYTVEYIDTRLTEEDTSDIATYQMTGTWNIYYSFNVLNYEAE
ncbi:MAG: hypothetical protein K5745_01650 [Saccharofermentans sp.]|nr:hypothetical protein [Saccharofermentans sp.]